MKQVYYLPDTTSALDQHLLIYSQISVESESLLPTANPAKPGLP
jgi:hypothetical protein